MAQSKLLYPQNNNKNVYPILRKQLNLVMDDFGTAMAPKDISYTYRGYAPLSVRLVQNALQAPNGGPSLGAKGIGWHGHYEMLKMIPGETIDVSQPEEDGSGNASQSLFQFGTN